MEALSQMIEKAVVGGFPTACHVGGRAGEGVEVSHLLFADDTLIFLRGVSGSVDLSLLVIDVV